MSIVNKKIKNKLLKIAKNKIKSYNDPSHDFFHTLRVLKLAEKIAIEEKADLDIVIPAAIFHDSIIYPKNHPKSHLSSKESSDFARKILIKLKLLPKDKIQKICRVIELCSFSKGISADFLEAKVLQDADRLEALGAIAIMRTFSSGGQMRRELYNYIDPFCEKRKPNDKKYSLDLFFTRLLLIPNKLHTKTAKFLAKKRINFLYKFLKQLKIELSQLKYDKI